MEPASGWFIRGWSEGQAGAGQWVGLKGRWADPTEPCGPPRRQGFVCTAVQGEADALAAFGIAR